MAQRRFDDNGEELILIPDAELVALRAKLAAIVAAERTRHAAIARWFLSPAGKELKPGKE